MGEHEIGIVCSLLSEWERKREIESENKLNKGHKISERKNKRNFRQSP